MVGHRTMSNDPVCRLFGMRLCPGGGTPPVPVVNALKKNCRIAADIDFTLCGADRVRRFSIVPVISPTALRICARQPLLWPPLRVHSHPKSLGSCKTSDPSRTLYKHSLPASFASVYSDHDDMDMNEFLNKSLTQSKTLGIYKLLASSSASVDCENFLCFGDTN